MTEEFLHFVWEQGLYNSRTLTGVNGEHIEVLAPGTHNTDSGPDFFNARVRIDGTVWAGNIEIHRNSSDWLRHHHHHNEAYSNIILHVVGNHDLQIARTGGEQIPELVLPFPAHLLDNYQQLLAAQTWIPCQPDFHAIDPFILKIGFSRLAVERLQEKTTGIAACLEQNRHDWNETFYHLLARNFGFKTNAVPFELLAKSIPLRILARHADNLFQLEALLFGQSGLLHEALIGDDYFLELRHEYGFLLKKYGLRPMAGHLWKFLRLRPVNFPTVRIAQMAALIFRNRNLLPAVLEISEMESLKELFYVTASEYWETHYKFNYPSRKRVKHLGSDAISNLIVNTVIPFLFVFGEQQSKPCLKERALHWLEALPAESNSVISKWQALGVEPHSAFESQALLQLKNGYCDAKACIRCHVGSKIIRKDPGEG